MIGFKNGKVEDIFTLKRGFDITKKEQQPGDIPVISSSGITSYHNKFKVEGPGVVTGRKGTLGKVFYYEGEFWPHDTTLWVEDFKGNNPRYIYYLLQQLNLENYDVGGANPTLNRNHVHKLDITYTEDKELQSKIANKLKIYDDLIENNNSRIKLLEESVDLIYKEWFVNLRFPGYENIEITNDIPKGWNKIKLGKFFPIITGKKNANISCDNGKYKFFTCAQQTSQCNEYSFEDTAILLAGNGEFNVKYYSGKFEAYQRTYVLIPYDKVYNLYLYECIKYNLPKMTNASKGSVIKYLTKDMIDNFIVYEPDVLTLNKFNILVEPIFKQINTLQIKNEKLKEARDILIPRLISGEIEV